MNPLPSFHVYVLYESGQDRLYTGQTSQTPLQRLTQHNQGQCQTTAGAGPWEMVFIASFQNHADAVAFEKYLKSGSGREFLRRHFLPAGIKGLPKNKQHSPK